MNEERMQAAREVKARLDGARQKLASLLPATELVMRSAGMGADWRATIVVRHPQSGLFLSVTTDNPNEVAQVIAGAPVEPIADPVV